VLPVTSTVNSSGYGAGFGLTAPRACLRKGTPFSVTVSIKKPKAKARGDVLVKVTKIVFAIGGKTVKTIRSAPFRVRLAVPPTAAAGSTIKLRAKAYLKTRSGKRPTKSITIALKVC
jgi:hypothetical protein